MSSEAEWAWAAGYYEGEGSITYLKPTKSMAIAIAQKDPASLYKFKEIVGAGNITGPYNTDSRAYYLRITKRHEVFRVVRGLWPWLTIRRQGQIATVFDRFCLARES